MPTTEEMNRVIEDYIDISVQVGATWCNKTANLIVDREVDMSKDWNWLMSVWDKLRDELEKTHKGDAKLHKSLIGAALYQSELERAHRLIYEAIVWLNQNKGK